MKRVTLTCFFVLGSYFVADSVVAGVRLDEDFDAGDGGFVSANNGAESPWAYNSGAGTWAVNGSTNLGNPSSSTLTSPEITATRTGKVVVTVNHRYSFEFDDTRWDGGAIFFQVNGGLFTQVPGANFTSNGYNGVITGNNALTNQTGFNGVSPNGARSDAGQAAEFFESTFELDLRVGDKLVIQFLGAWDEFAQGGLPNWEITQVTIADAALASIVPAVSTRGLYLLMLLMTGAGAVAILRSRKLATA